MQEAFGGSQLPFFRAGGFLLKDDYARFYANGPVAPPEDERPYLMGLFREDPESRLPGSAISYLFRSDPPRFRFSRAEQQVLLRALMDESDETIAEDLGVSPDTVKKTWRRIHQRADTVAPDLLATASDMDAMRGKERRRALIRHLRYHLEELRPYARLAAP